MITAVTGLTRSGTSLMMQMLDAGGISIYRDHDKPISNETMDIYRLPHDSSWLRDADGKAVKFLDAQNYLPLPADHGYRFIIMKRDSLEQAKSIYKFIHQWHRVPIVPSVASLRTMAASIRKDIKRVELGVARRGPVLVVRFERLIEDREREATRVAKFCGLVDAAVYLMADAVLDRSPRCLDGMLEEQLEAVFRISEQTGLSPRLVYRRMSEVGAAL
jgi:hypothetical protein